MIRVPLVLTQIRSKNVFGYRAFPVRTVAAATHFFMWLPLLLFHRKDFFSLK